MHSSEIGLTSKICIPKGDSASPPLLCPTIIFCTLDWRGKEFFYCASEKKYLVLKVHIVRLLHPKCKSPKDYNLRRLMQINQWTKKNFVSSRLHFLLERMTTLYASQFRANYCPVMSAIWNFFTKVDLNKNRAVCNDCKTELACNGGTTSGLKNHLKSKHKDQYQQFSNATPVRLNPSTGLKRKAEDDLVSQQPKMKDRKLEDCIPQSQAALDKAFTDAIIDFLADSGVAFRVVGLASFDKLMKIANKRIKLKDPRTYSRLMKIKAAEIKKDILEIIAAVKGDLTCVGFTTDMWTSAAGHPFMSLTVHMIDKNWVLHRFVLFLFNFLFVSLFLYYYLPHFPLFTPYHFPFP